MSEKVNYMHEIRRIEKRIDTIEETADKEKNSDIKELNNLLDKLKETANDMAAYIRGDWDDITIINLKKGNSLKDNNQEYLLGLVRLLHLERVANICKTKTPDEIACFLSEYVKYKDEQKEVRLIKVR